MVHKIILKSRDEWKANRKRIGGSDAAAVIGKNPYMTNVELWEIKSGIRQQEDISEKPYVKYGTEAEKFLRELFKLDFPEYEVCYQDNNIWVNDDYPWAHASLDGWLIDSDGRKGIWECKTSNILQSMQKEKWNQQIPENYYCQILHYFIVTGFDFAVLKAQLKSEFKGEIYLQTKHYKIEREDVLDDIEYLKKMEEQFWKHIVDGTKPSLLLPDM